MTETEVRVIPVLSRVRGGAIVGVLLALRMERTRVAGGEWGPWAETYIEFPEARA